MSKNSKGRSFPTVADMARLDPYIDRKKIAKEAGIKYQTYCSKLRAHRQGRTHHFNLEDQKALKEVLLDLGGLISTII